MLRFIPYTVVAGFLAGSGILILQAGPERDAYLQSWHGHCLHLLVFVHGVH